MNTFCTHLRKTVIMMVFFAFGLTASAQWTRTAGPEGGYAAGLFATSEFVLVGLEDGGVYRSTDLGATWQYASYGLTAEGSGGNCFAVLGPYVFVGSDRGVSRSTDQGMTWSALDIDAPFGGIAVSSLALNGSTLYLGSPWYGVYSSTDSGTSWVKKSTGLSDTTIMALIADAGLLYAGTDGSGVFESSDNGDSWHLSSSGLGGGNAQRVYHLASGGGIVIAGTRAGAYRSTDHGVTWSAAASGMTSRDVASLGVFGTDFLAGTYGSGVFRSTNGGIDWEPSSTGWSDGNVRAFGVSSGVLFGGSYGESVVYASTDGGVHWSPSGNGITSKSITALAAGGSRVLAGTGDGLDVTTDAGATWTDAAEFTNKQLYAFASSGGWTFAGTGGQGLFASSNQGESWIDANGNLPASGWRPVYSAAADPTYVYIGTADGVYRSSDYGVSWEPAKAGMTDSVAYALCSANGTIFAGTNTLMYRSTDHGTTWTASTNGLRSYRILSIVNVDSVVLAAYAFGGNPTVYRSTDAGDSWNPTTDGLATYSTTIQTLHVHGKNVFGGTSANGVWLSTDRGESWSDISEGLSGPGLAISALTTVGEFLYAGAERGGVWKRPLSDVVVSVEGKTTFGIAGSFGLEQNYPNPFNPTTIIRYSVGGSRLQGSGTSDVRLVVYDVLGREVAVLVNEKEGPGNYQVTFEAGNLTSGTYFYRLRTGAIECTRCMILVK